MRLIINADDLGISPEVNESIFTLMARGLVTSASILANGPEAAAAMQSVARFPTCSFGVHLNITQFRPLSSEPHLAHFLGSDGQFKHSTLRPALAPAVTEAIVGEWLQQVEWVRSHWIAPSHVDSHHHVHAHPYLFPAISQLQRRAGIRCVRIAKNVNGPRFEGDQQSSAGDGPLRLARWAYNTGLRFGARTTDGFTSLMEFYEMQRAGLFDTPTWRRRAHWTLELMVHPGHENYREETEILESGWLAQLPHARVSYNDI